jgi:hypothetical protein
MRVPKPVIVPAYQDRMTAFVDILGFSDLIAHSRESRSAFDTVFLSLREVLRTRPPWDDPGLRDQLFETGRKEAARLGRQLSREEHDKILNHLSSCDRAFAFSDNVVRSSPANWAGAVSVTFSMVTLALRLLAQGVFVRGGVALGQLCHDDSMVFGPALIEAYRIQQELARYPRIVLSPDVVGLMCTDPPYGKDPQIQMQAIIQLNVTDGTPTPYLHFLSERAISGAGFPGDQGRKIVSAIRSQLVGKLALYGGWPVSIQSKLRWFIEYFNHTIDSGTGVSGIAIIENLPWN